ncbi:MAG: class I SAM-dependent methyltransferase [Bacteroidales bacterium]|jgi:predicted O-methyltransferase YrrM|nr:class I SAM-dependent methyltransferase [Bacteroidales bacterium]NLM93845.1 class I SAM-dependent methyltransferase [Bacteroidales bacterium]
MFLNRHVVLQFLFRKPFGVHSPFVYDFADQCLFSKVQYPEFALLEKQRKDLLNDPAELDVVDYGRGVRGRPRPEVDAPLLYKRKVSSIAARSLQSPALCALLYRSVMYFSPLTILELGTSLGITTAYLAKAAPHARIITLEGCGQTAARAEALFKKNSLSNIEVRTGAFQHTLIPALDDLKKPDLVYLDGDHSYEGVMNNYRLISKYMHNNSVLILDDIRWSKGMRKAWLEIAADNYTSLAIDLFRLGIVFFNPGLSKQIIPLGY